MSGTDIGPGMCLIDRWVRQKSKKNYDENGIIAKSGRVNKIVLNQRLNKFYEKENFFNRSRNDWWHVSSPHKHKRTC